MYKWLWGSKNISLFIYYVSEPLQQPISSGKMQALSSFPIVHYNQLILLVLHFVTIESQDQIIALIIGCTIFCDHVRIAVFRNYRDISDKINFEISKSNNHVWYILHNIL